MLAAEPLAIRQRPAVFKRWSRKPYAAFASLHREVVIGVLKASICYASMLKMGILMTDAHCPETTHRVSTDDDDGPGGGGASLFASQLLEEVMVGSAIADRRAAGRQEKFCRDGRLVI